MSCDIGEVMERLERINSPSFSSPEFTEVFPRKRDDQTHSLPRKNTMHSAPKDVFTMGGSPGDVSEDPVM